MNPPPLPIEILEAILDYTTKSEQLALCSSSKLLYDLGSRMLYRELTFTCSSQLVQCFTVLKSKQSHALAVTLLNITTGSHILHLRAYFRLIRDVLPRLSSLIDLSIDGHFENYGDIVDNCMFPRLRALHFCYFEGHYIPNFLGRHSNITSLSLYSDKEYPTSDLPPVYLPNLRLYMSPTYLYPAWLSRSTSLEALLLLCDFADPMTRKTFEALSHTPAKRLGLQLIGWDLECCGVVSKALPALKVINIRNFFKGNLDVTVSQFIEYFSTFLPIFTHLEDITIVESTPSPLSFSVLDREHERVIKWRSTCSELKRCEFDAGVIWTLRKDLRYFTWEPAAKDVVMSGDLIHQWQQQKLD